MSCIDSPCIVGDYWLDKRRDGKSPDIWQIATYSEQSRSIVYRSTKRRTGELTDAKAILRAHEAAARSKGPQDASQAELLPHLFNYLREHGPDVVRLDTIKSSFRAWIGFLMQDELGLSASVADINKVSVARFRRWRMGAHSWEIEWDGKIYRHNSEGVSGEAVQRNIEDLRSALYHAEAAGRIVAPRIPSVDASLRAEPRDTVLDYVMLGAILGYAREDAGAYRELCLMIGTCCRPGAALSFDPTEQWLDGTIDFQIGHRKTNKRRPIVPVIAPLNPILEEWKADPHARVKSRKTFWRTMRRALALPDEIEAYTIRHTLVTFMDAEGVPGAQLSGIAGHIPKTRGSARTTERSYLHYSPTRAAKAVRVLTKFFAAVMHEADKWAADHSRTIPVRGKPLAIAGRPANV